MTKVNTLKDVIVGIAFFSQKPIYSVTYNEPSKEDEDWALNFYPVSLQVFTSEIATRYAAEWRFIDDHQAREDYPLFRTLAMKYNWLPLREPHWREEDYA